MRPAGFVFRQMLHLLQPTPTHWVAAVREDLDGLLADHAHCELKAAQSALSLIGRFGAEDAGLIEPLADLAREETQHFRQVHQHIEARGGSMTRPAKDEYVNALRSRVREDHGEAPVLLDRLLIAALIEARSCERFKILADGLSGLEDELADFYRALMAAEARHFTLFFGLAEERFGADARRRLASAAQREAEVVHHLPLGPTVHG